MNQTLKISLTRNPGRIFPERFLIRLFLVVVVIFVVMPFQLNAQTTQRITVTGIVTDGTTHEAMPGINVVVQGTTLGTTTDLSGKFTIVVPSEQSVLNFSFIGYTPMSITVGKQRNLSVVLASDLQTLDEVVVVGYGVQKKESVVGAVTQATGDLVKSSVQGADLGNALTGTLPGLVTISTTGLPGGQGEDDDFAIMYIRGQKTWNSASPLVLVDGVERPLQNINPYEIEKISVLKDASATAVFGVKGANGVIMITTLRGKEGKPVFSFDVTGTAKTVSRLPHLENSYTANRMKNFAILNELPISETSWPSVVPERWLDLYKSQKYPYYLPDVDWKDEFLNDYGYDKNTNLNVSGGTKFVKYFGSLGYTGEGDIFKIQDYGQGYSPNFSFSRYNYRSNLDFDITSTTRFSANFSGFFANSARPAGDKYRGFSNLYSQPPDLWPAQYQDGTWGDYAGYDRFANGILGFNFMGQNFTKTTNINTDFMLDQKLDFVLKGLSVNGKLSYDNTSVSTGPNIIGYGRIAKWIDPRIVDDPRLTDNMTPDQIAALESEYDTWKFPTSETLAVPTGYNWMELPNAYSSEAGDNASTYRNLYYQVSLNYARDFGKHSVSGLALMSRQIQSTGSQFPSYREDWVGRVTYGYDRRYMLEFNAAYNGSEKFAPEYRFGFFPSMAFGWVVSNEPFFQPLKKYINTIKFRYSDGKVGSDEGTPRWLYVGDWNVRPNTTSGSSEDVMRFGYPYLVNSYPLRYEGVIPNPAIQWETAHKRDLGIETGFLKDMLKVNFDYFTEERDNIFMSGSDIVLPAYFGAKPVSANLGKVSMHGWEFEVNFSKTTTSGFNYWVNHSWTFAKDKIIERGDPELKPAYQKQAGYQIGQPRVTVNQTGSPMLTWNEIYNSVQGTDNSELLPGDFAVIDYNSDGIIDKNDNIPYGYPSRPQFTYAPSAGASYKNLSANVRFYGVYNVEGEAGTYAGTFSNQFSILFPRDIERSWSPEMGLTSDAIQPGLRFITSASSGYIPTSRAYLKLQHAEIGYNIMNNFVKKLGVTRLRVTLSGDNLILWSDMTEDLDADRPTVQTNTRRTYPKMKRYNLGISLGF
jgi:TonB-linked SusC/RagA family outer membrane protein